MLRSRKVLAAVNTSALIISLCRRKNIAVEAYSSLTRGQRLADEKLIKIAKKYNKSPAQILIRWVIDNNLIVIPKSVHQHRIIENGNVFDFALSKEDLEVMNSWDERLVTSGWDPRTQKW